MNKNNKTNLSDLQKSILFEKNTERPGTGELLHNKLDGKYACVNCGNTLFTSESKYDSGSGWPSFYDVESQDSVALTSDSSHGMVRTEVNCSKCGGHLGHLFDDGPVEKTGNRYCINSACLSFKKIGTR